MAPLDVNLSVSERQPAVRGVRAHPEIGEEPCGSSTAEKSVGLETDAVRSQPQAGQKIRSRRFNEVNQAVRIRNGAFQKPQERVRKSQVFDVNSVVCCREVRSDGNARTSTRIHLAVSLEGTRQNKVSIFGKWRLYSGGYLRG